MSLGAVHPNAGAVAATGHGPLRGAHGEFRGDIQGLRAVAVLLVVLWHGGVTLLPGGFVGVDVFFVISGFLITEMLISQLRTSGRFSLVGFYARRAKRLLPAAATALVGALLVTYFFLPKIRWAGTAADVVASSLYVVNWRFAGQSTDYLAQNTAPSIVQHYWTLSVEEQFYLVWPLLLLLVTALIRWLGWSVEFGLALAFGAVFVPSFAWSIFLSEAEPERAYFVTTTRMWEFALGGSLAIFLPRIMASLQRWLAAVAGWAGMAAVLFAALFYGESTAFPGSAAFVPTIGAVGIIVGGLMAGRLGPAVVLDTRPMRAIGALSYSLYLWHWIVLVAADARFGPLTAAGSLAAVAFSVLPAWLTYRYVENPIRYAPRFRLVPARALRLGLLVTFVPVLAAAVLISPPVVGGTRAGWMPAVAGENPMGAGVLKDPPRGDPRGGPTDRVSELFPDPLLVRGDLPSVYDEGCHQDEKESAVTSCLYGPSDAKYRVAIVGDSHAAQWVPALRVAGDARRWRVVTYTKSGCPLLSAQVPYGARQRTYRSCIQWNANVLAQLVGDDRPDLVVTTNYDYQLLRDGKPLAEKARWTAFVEGLRTSWRALTSAGLPVIVIRDTPRPGLDIAECIEKHTDRLTECAFPRDQALAGVGPIQAEAAAGMAGVHMVDLNDAICPTDTCAPVIGQVIVYRDDNHLTATYARSLGPRLEAAIDAVMSPPPPRR
jgi:peptidoglycan/LPS O-acetylase OafA/YrhL